ncbi:MAG: GNAT family N-acetyltransferase [Pseudomonadota bacterium]
MTCAPEITTERLRLRPHVAEDMAAFEAFYKSDRSDYVGRPKNRTHQWYAFASETGSWALSGWGAWAIETRDEQLVGQVALRQPPHFPELELGWILFEGFEGKGYAFEAAKAARDFAFTVLDVPTLVSYVDHRNTRSRALAERMGAILDPAAKTYDDVDVVYRHPHPDGDLPDGTGAAQ